MPSSKYSKITLYSFLAIIAVFGVFTFGVHVGLQKKTEIGKVAVAGVSRALADTAWHDSAESEKTDQTQVDFEPFWKVWNIINEKYPNGKVTDQEKVWGAISGLTDSLKDPYTVFFPPQENKLFKDTISGEFGGVGMEVGIKDKVLTVIAPIKGTPSYNAGIKAGDKIIKIDDTLTADLSIDKAVSLIRGQKGTKVTLTIWHENESEPKEVIVTRSTIVLPTLDTEIRSDGIFVIKLYNFSSNSTALFRDALRKFVESKSKKLILDLRGNPGGYLDAAIDMASWFLPVGKPVVLENFNYNIQKTVYRSKGYNIFNKNLKMIILVDGGSASASEILAGALKEHGIAKLVGEKTYGKGSVQELIQITPETSIKITIAKWLTPNGISISENGLDPDVVVQNPKPKEGDKAEQKDLQFDKAVELLK